MSSDLGPHCLIMTRVSGLKSVKALKKPGPSFQSITSLTVIKRSSLNVLGLYKQILGIFVNKMREALAKAKASHIISTKHTGVFERC